MRGPGELPQRAAVSARGFRPRLRQNRATVRRANVPALRRNLRRPSHRSCWRERRGAARLLPAGRQAEPGSRGTHPREGSNPRRMRADRCGSAYPPTRLCKMDDRASRIDESVLPAETEMFSFPFLPFNDPVRDLPLYGPDPVDHKDAALDAALEPGLCLVYFLRIH